MGGHVLDTSAIFCVLFDEDGADQVATILERQGKPPSSDTVVLVPFIALMETEYQLLRRLTAGEVERILLMVENWPIHVQESSSEWRHEAARVKASVALSLADAWIASLATLTDSELVHKDPEFDQIEELKAVRLPYK